MLDIFFFIAYRWILIPTTIFILRLFRPFLPAKIQLMLKERNSPQRPVLWARPIWIHASSGEIEYAKPVLRELKARYPHIPILVTYFSPSAHRLTKDIQELDFLLPLPFDHHKIVRKFITYVNPLAVLFSRTDVWPELALQLHQRQIPTLLFSATLSEESSRRKGFGRFFSRFAFNQLDEIFCVNDEDRRIFQNLGVTSSVKTHGDTRFDQVLYRLKHPKELKNLKPSCKNVLVAGSTWPADEKVILPALQKFIQQDGFVILAPHEVNDAHLCKLETWFDEKGIPNGRYSQIESLGDIRVLIVDQIGILPEMYLWGNIAFVGGSFKDRVHSVMEPLAAGLPVIVGPYHQNNREALHFALKFFVDDPNRNTMVSVVKDTEEFHEKITSLCNLASQQDLRAQIQAQVAEHTGLSSDVALWPPLIQAIEQAKS